MSAWDVPPQNLHVVNTRSTPSPDGLVTSVREAIEKLATPSTARAILDVVIQGDQGSGYFALIFCRGDEYQRWRP